MVVVTGPDRPAGRGKKMTPNPLATFARTKGLAVLKPERLDKNALNKLNSLSKNFVVGVCCVYGKIIPDSWLEFFPQGIINVHPSLLPLYRGPSPAQFAILAGEKEAGITIMKMDSQVDHGPILFQIKERIKENDTAQDLYQRLFDLAANNIVKVTKDYLAGKIKPKAQNHQKATFTGHLSRKDGFISSKKIFSQPIPQEVDQKRRAFAPWPGIHTKVKIGGKEKILKILKTHLKKGKTVIDQVQLEGKRPVTFSQFCSAYELKI